MFAHDLCEMDLAEAREAIGWGKLAFDVGANKGQNLPTLLALFDRVIALEPAVESYSCIPSDDRAVLLNVAAGPVDGTVSLSERVDPIQSGQLVAPGVTNHNWGQEIGIREVSARKLDSLAAEYGVPDFVKIDTEGGELDVLAGAGDLIALGMTRWLVEYHSPAGRGGVLSLFEGYQVETHLRAAPGSWEALNHGYLRIYPSP